jgi:hypothetical protein
VQHPWSQRTAASSLLVVSAAALLTGCAAGDNEMATMAVPPSETTQAPGVAQQPPMAGPPAMGAQPGTLIVTTQQRAYLDALAAAGLKPSSELLALSIGSYVCQARAAKQSDQAVWDYVLPLVRSDVRNAHLSAMVPSEAVVDAATAGYIRIATERLC